MGGGVGGGSDGGVGGVVGGGVGGGVGGVVGGGVGGGVGGAVTHNYPNTGSQWPVQGTVQIGLNITQYSADSHGEETGDLANRKERPMLWSFCKLFSLYQLDICIIAMKQKSDNNGTRSCRSHRSLAMRYELTQKL
uniref:Uncharacterized protein n=1 Tax=Anopheles merus TaxID=30066 RepID=A0A182VNR3_ANOME